MASLAITNEGTPSMIEEVDDDMAALGHVSNRQLWDTTEMDFRMEAPRELIDSVAKSTTEDPMGRPEKNCSAGSKNPDGSSAEILAWLMMLSLIVKHVWAKWTT